MGVVRNVPIIGTIMINLKCHSFICRSTTVNTIFLFQFISPCTFYAVLIVNNIIFEQFQYYLQTTFIFINFSSLYAL